MVRRFFVGFLAIIGFLVLLLVVGLGSFAWWASGRIGGEPLPDAIVLELDLRQSLSEAPSLGGFSGLGIKRGLTVSEVVLALDRAGRDPRVSGLLAIAGDQTQGMGIAQELRQAVGRFRATGRDTVIWSDSFGELTSGLEAYYLATAFDQIALQPAGMVGVSGITAEMPFLRGLLDKLGIEPVVRQRMEYKTAFENFAASAPSAPNREMTETILDDVWSRLVQDVAAARGLPEDEAQRLLGSGPWTGEEALRAKLIDRLSYLDDSRRTMGPDRVVPLVDYAEAEATPAVGPTVALVRAEGMISRGDDDLGSGIRSHAMARMLGSQVDDDKVAAIVLRIDSPGGSPVASEAIAHELRRARQAGKPVIVSMGNVAASGGYWIVMDADRIVAQPLTLTGSIGVIAGKPVVADALDRLGVGVWQTGRGQNAGMWALTQGFAGPAGERVDFLLDDIYNRFKDGVAQGRKLDRDKVDEIAKGRVWTGAAAQRLGLVDRTGGLIEALAEVRLALKLDEAADLDIRLLPEAPSPFALVQELIAGGLATATLADRMKAVVGAEGSVLAVVPRLH